MRSLGVKLILAFLAVSLMATILLTLMAGQSTATEFGAFIFDQAQAEMAQNLASYYQRNEGWAGVEEILSTDAQGAGQNRGGPPPDRGPGARLGRNVALVDAAGYVLVPGMSYRAGERVSTAVLNEGTPIEVDGQVVGTLLRARGMSMANPAGEAFLERVNRALVIAATGATIIALLLGVLLARALTRPLRELTTATRAVAHGELGKQVTVRSQDELGDLAAAFNQMSRDLAYAQERRRQLTADIAHDLRTPISIIQGHAEALRDGVLPPTAETFDLVHDEALRLSRLVEDLRTLTRAETGELPLVSRPVAVEVLLESIAAAQGPRAQAQDIQLVTDMVPDLPVVNVDPDRMAQVLNNLVDNALRHTPAQGTVTLAARETAAKVHVRISDTGPGIAPEDLPHIFERFYRGDKARRRQEGGSGLGLAIARSIVEGHGGRIWAESKPGEGATFIIELSPAAPTEEKAVER